MRLYLSAAIANAPINLRLQRALAPRFELVLPQTFTPQVEHTQLSRGIVRACLDEMERCDGAVVLLDALGVDCAMECGWLFARGKPIVGLAGSTVWFTRHWMVKGTLSAVIALDVDVSRALHEDPILSTVPLRSCSTWDEVGGVLAEVLECTRAQREDR